MHVSLADEGIEASGEPGVFGLSRFGGYVGTDPNGEMGDLTHVVMNGWAAHVEPNHGGHGNSATTECNDGA